MTYPGLQGLGCMDTFMHMHMQAFTHIHMCTHAFTVYVRKQENYANLKKLFNIEL